MTLDLSTLTVTDAPEAPKSAHRGRPATANPFLDVILDSWNGGEPKPKAVTVPNGKDVNNSGDFVNVTSVTSLIRRAAAAQGLGARLELIEKGKTQTEIRFIAKEKTERARKAKNTDETTDESAA